VPSLGCRAPETLPPSPANSVPPSGAHARHLTGASSTALRASLSADTLQMRTVASSPAVAKSSLSAGFVVRAQASPV
jgi:hypothetical protein